MQTPSTPEGRIARLARGIKQPSSRRRAAPTARFLAAPPVAAGPVAESLERRLCLSASQFTAAAGSPFAAGQGPDAVVTGDFDGKGGPDLAVANSADGTVSILLGNGAGGFTAAAGSPISIGGNPAAIAAGDFLGNGRTDLAVTNNFDDTITILLSNGDGTFTPADSTIQLTGDNPGSMVAADFDGDGKADLAIADSSAGTVTILLSNGDGTFTESAGSPVNVGNNPDALTVGDFNPTGGTSSTVPPKLDLAVANSFDGTVSVLLGNGDGSFTEAAGSPVAVGQNPSAVASGAFLGDGHTDLAVANATDGTVSILKGDGAGGFTATGSPLAVGTQPTSIATGDFGGTGRTSLAVANATGNSVTVLLANANGTFTAAPGSPVPAGSAPRAIVAGKFDANGSPDLAVADFLGNNVTVLLNGGTTTPSPTPLVTGVSVGSTSWSASFPYGPTGYAVPTGSAQLTDLPWVNLNQVKISFNEAVNVKQASLAVTGVNTPGYATSGFSYNPATFTATWTFAAPLGADKLKLDLAASGANAVTGAAGGAALDGTFANGSSAFPSGGNAPGTDFAYNLNVLPGDVAQKGGPVNILEVIQTRNAQLTKPGDANYSPFYDVDGSGGINILDVIAVRNRQLSKLPAGSP